MLNGIFQNTKTDLHHKLKKWWWTVIYNINKSLFVSVNDLENGSEYISNELYNSTDKSRVMMMRYVKITYNINTQSINLKLYDYSSSSKKSILNNLKDCNAFKKFDIDFNIYDYKDIYILNPDVLNIKYNIYKNTLNLILEDNNIRKILSFNI